MAGLCSIKILLLLAGIISVADCQDSSDVVSTLSPARITTNLNSSPVVSLPFTSSPPHTMATSAVSSDLPAATHKPSLTSTNPSSYASIQTTISTTTSPAITTPASTSNETTPTTISTSNQTDSQAISTLTQTSPPITQFNTTVNPTMEATWWWTPPQCSYTVTPFKFGIQINFMNSSLGTYIINVKEEGRNENVYNNSVQHSDPNIQHNITHLKPCTVYEHNVTFNDNGKEKLCNRSDDKTTKTMEMTKDDIKLGSCIPGYLCYQSDWNISSVNITANNIEAKQCPNDNKTFCIRLHYDDICTDLNTTFTQEKCADSCSLTQHISAVEFLNSNEINVTAPTKLPGNIITHLPSKCTNLTIDYICSDSYNKTMNVSDLEPFTDYNCTGQIKEKNVTNNVTDYVTIKNTTAFHVRIDCDLQIQIESIFTNTSIDLSWTTTSEKCKEVPKRDGLSYNCSCHAPDHKKNNKSTVNKQPPGGTCHFSGVESYTDYTCKVQPTYKMNKSIAEPTEVTKKTDAGVPDRVSELKPSVPENNVINVTCHHRGKFRGPKKLYNATLSYDYVIQKMDKQNKCEFVFKDLSYSTTYVVEVVAFNGHLSSKAQTKSVDTRYNDKAVIGFVVFFIISVVLVVVVYMIYTMKRRNSQNVNEDVMLESTAIYENVPQWHQNEAR